jgi:hypothetical protein
MPFRPRRPAKPRNSHYASANAKYKQSRLSKTQITQVTAFDHKGLHGKRTHVQIGATGKWVA